MISANFLIDAESNLKAALKGFCRAGAAAMIARLIAWSARNLLLVLFGTGFAAAAGIYALRPSAARRHPRSLRHAGHRLHRISRPGAAGDRGPGHLSADDGDARRCRSRRWCAASRSSACRSSMSSSRTAPTSIGRARACSNILNGAASRLPAGVTPTHRARRDRRRLGLPVCRDRRRS